MRKWKVDSKNLKYSPCFDVSLVAALLLFQLSVIAFLKGIELIASTVIFRESKPDVKWEFRHRLCFFWLPVMSFPDWPASLLCNEFLDSQSKSISVRSRISLKNNWFHFHVPSGEVLCLIIVRIYFAARTLYVEIGARKSPRFPSRKQIRVKN